MHTILFPESGRGHANHGWLIANHSFSFARFYDPKRMGFGALRVLNDDVITAGSGFATHPHNDMEIITIVLQGQVAHRDSQGNVQVVSADEAQWMSAGRGVTHSEVNPSSTEALHLLQIWITPRATGLHPSYDQKPFRPEGRQGTWQLVASADGAQGSIRIEQDAWLQRTELQPGQQLDYQIRNTNNVLYAHVISGKVDLAGNTLSGGDGLGILAPGASLSLVAAQRADVLLFELPQA